jgi:hypothetical protein
MSGNPWFGFVVPGRTPRPIIDWLNREATKAFTAKDVAGRYAQQGFILPLGTPDAFGAHILDERKPARRHQGELRRSRNMLQAVDDPEITLAGIVEHLQRRLVAGTVVAGDRRVDAVEFNDHHALGQPGFVGLGGIAAGEEFPASRQDRGACELGISRELVGIVDRTIERYPICLRHVVEISVAAAAQIIERLPAPVAHMKPLCMPDAWMKPAAMFPVPLPARAALFPANAIRGKTP